jgi:branched-chain amino acid transport system ATP-binding protein
VTEDTILHARGLHKHFQGIHVLTNVELRLPRARITALIGSNGAGKSTLLNVISGFLASDGGLIEFDGHRIESLPSYRRARLGISRSFQHPRVFGSMTVLESVLVAATPVGEERLSRNIWRIAGGASAAAAQATAVARTALDTCRLAHRAATAVRDLGYGEQKLLMLAQLLAKGGKLLCLDELCAGLEDVMVAEIILTLRELLGRGMTILFIEHNLDLVRAIADEIVFLHQGTIMRSGTADVVLEDPEVNRLYLGQ